MSMGCTIPESFWLKRERGALEECLLTKKVKISLQNSGCPEKAWYLLCFEADASHLLKLPTINDNKHDPLNTKGPKGRTNSINTVHLIFLHA